MISIRKTDDYIKKNVNQNNDIIEMYDLLLDDKVIGYSTINNDINNVLSLYINEDYRGNGYGKAFFEKMLIELKKNGHKEIILMFSKHNFIMKRIIQSFNGLEISLYKEKIKYVVPLKKV